MPSRIRVFVDFDGTIALEDTTDVILERFAHPAWRTVEAEWLAGRIGSRECLSRQVDLVRASPGDLDSVAEDVPLDPHFVEFIALCRRHRAPLTVISDGFDRVIARMLARAGIALPVLANRLDRLGDNRWRIAFPHGSDGCRAEAGHCKCLALTREPDTVRILIGDGRSDFCAAESADLILAKGALAEHCQARELPYLVFGNLAGATSLLAHWIGALDQGSEAPAAAEGSIRAPSA